MCFTESINDTCYFRIELANPCDKAIDWFQNGYVLGDFINLYMTKSDGTLIEPKDIIRVIQLWNADFYFESDELPEKIGLCHGPIRDIGKFINKLNPQFCASTENEIMKNILEPIIVEAFKLFDGGELQ
jgi:hypothetical protein